MSFPLHSAPSAFNIRLLTHVPQTSPLSHQLEVQGRYTIVMTHEVTDPAVEDLTLKMISAPENLRLIKV